MAEERDKASELACLLVLVGLLFYAWTWFPTLPVWSVDTQKDLEARGSLMIYTASVLKLEYSEIRVSPGFAGSVVLYLPSKAYEKIPIPDRKFTLSSITKSYCDKIRKPLARIDIKDIYSNKSVESSSCLFGAK